MNNESYKHYLIDLITILKEDAQAAIEEYNNEHSEWSKARVSTYADILDVMKDQAETFQLPL